MQQFPVGLTLSITYLLPNKIIRFRKYVTPPSYIAQNVLRKNIMIILKLVFGIILILLHQLILSNLFLTLNIYKAIVCFME